MEVKFEAVTLKEEGFGMSRARDFRTRLPLTKQS